MELVELMVEAQRELVEELVETSRALVGITVRSVEVAPVEVTIPQHRVLLLLVTQGPQSIGELAAHLGVNPSNASRQCDRLQRLDLVRRTRSTQDARVVRVEPTETGRRVVEEVAASRRQELAALVARIPDVDRGPLLQALRGLNAVARVAAPSPENRVT